MVGREIGFRAAIPVSPYTLRNVRYLAEHEWQVRDHGANMTHQKFEGERTLMRIHIGESDKWHSKPLHEAIVEMLRRDGFSGATVLRGVGGYGGSSVYLTDKLLLLFHALPIILQASESALRLAKILSRFDPMVNHV